MNISLPFLVDELIGDLTKEITELTNQPVGKDIKEQRRQERFNVLRGQRIKLLDLKTEAVRNNCWR